MENEQRLLGDVRRDNLSERAIQGNMLHEVTLFMVVDRDVRGFVVTA